MNIKQLASLVLLSSFGMMIGCQSNPSLDPNSPDNINLGGELPSHSMLEISYLCNNTQNKNNQTPNGQLISVFYDSRHAPSNQSQATGVNNAHNQRVTLRIGNNDYPMQSMAENTYINQQATADGNWLIWHAPTASQGQLIVSKTADMQQIVSQQLCQMTR